MNVKRRRMSRVDCSRMQQRRSDVRSKERREEWVPLELVSNRTQTGERLERLERLVVNSESFYHRAHIKCCRRAAELVWTWSQSTCVELSSAFQEGDHRLKLMGRPQAAAVRSMNSKSKNSSTHINTTSYSSNLLGCWTLVPDHMHHQTLNTSYRILKFVWTNNTFRNWSA